MNLCNRFPTLWKRAALLLQWWKLGLALPRGFWAFSCGEGATWTPALPSGLPDHRRRPSAPAGTRGSFWKSRPDCILLKPRALRWGGLGPWLCLSRVLQPLSATGEVRRRVWPAGDRGWAGGRDTVRSFPQPRSRGSVGQAGDRAGTQDRQVGYGGRSPPQGLVRPATWTQMLVPSFRH